MRWKTNSMLMTGWIVLSVLLTIGAVAIILTAHPDVQPLPPATMSLPTETTTAERYRIAVDGTEHKRRFRTNPVPVFNTQQNTIE